ncbi:hypothetical protein [Sphingobium psychrophilum]|uniref:hypothetical protein n=1 Tax=Sphingobium psychrophilum TaxID=2728834 RepID=UPI00146E8C82|nr:hypothetical protein [Sphingobium psychrophilum]
MVTIKRKVANPVQPAEMPAARIIQIGHAYSAASAPPSAPNAGSIVTSTTTCFRPTSPPRSYF